MATSLRNVQAKAGGDGGCQTAAQGAERIAAFEMNDVRKKDDERVAVGIDPERRSGKARVAIGADGKQFAAIAGERRIDIPTEATQNGLIGWAAGFGELANGFGIEEVNAVVSAHVGEHLGVFGEVSAVVKTPAWPAMPPI